MGIKPLLDAANKRRADAIKKMDKLTGAVATEGRTALSADEAAKFEKLATEIREADEAIVSFSAQLAREATPEVASAHSFEVHDDAKMVVTRETMTYDQHSRNSYMRDLAALMVPQSGLDAQGASLRMAQHHKEAEIEARRDSKLAAALGEMRRTPGARESRVNPNTTAGTGGEFVPPLWLVAQYVPFVRPGRVFADRCQSFALPAGIDVINLPKITTGTLTAIQSAQGGAVASQDIVTSTVSAKVNTIAGQEDISLQLLEQSPISMDGVIYDDLSRDYDQRLDLQVIAGTGTGGQHLGVLSVPGATSNTSANSASFINSTNTTLTSASNATSQLRDVINGVNQIETLRFAPPTAMWVHPRRANFWGGQTDGSNRPVYIPNKYGVYNGVGLNEGSPTFQGIAGELYGLPVVKDANQVTLGLGFTGTAYNTTGGAAGSTGQDAVVVLKEDDLYLWEGTMRMRALPEILSGTLQIRYQLYAYSAFMPNRFPQSVSIISGTGYNATNTAF